MVIRIFLAKAKRLLKLNKNFIKNSNLETVIASHKPPIFWKEKEIIKSQMKIWTLQRTQKLIDHVLIPVANVDLRWTRIYIFFNLFIGNVRFREY